MKIGDNVFALLVKANHLTRNLLTRTALMLRLCRQLKFGQEEILPNSVTSFVLSC